MSGKVVLERQAVLRSLFWVFLLLSLVMPTAIAEPLPEFFGVYALAGEKLIEIKPLPQAYRPGMGVGGSDVIQSLEYTRLPQGEVQFIVFAQGATSYMQLPARRVSRVWIQENLSFSGEQVQSREKIVGYWHPTDDAEILRVAPISANPTMMVRAVPQRPLADGVWALDIGGVLYAFSIGSAPEEETACEVRRVHITGVKFRPCLENERSQVVAQVEAESERELCSRRGTAVVDGIRVLLMSAPDPLSNTIQVLKRGVEVKTLGEYSEGYCKIDLNSTQGWVRGITLRSP